MLFYASIKLYKFLYIGLIYFLLGLLWILLLLQVESIYIDSFIDCIIFLLLCNKLHNLSDLTQIYYFPVLGVRSPEQVNAMQS